MRIDVPITLASLVDALTGRRPTSETLASDGSFGGGARTPVPVAETHEQLLSRVLVSREADVGHRT